MIYLIARFLRKEALIIFLLSAAVIFAGCASNKADVEKLDDVEVSVTPNLITDIITAEDSESTTVTVRGNHFLTYTSIKQDIPLGILFYFHETGLDESIQSIYTPESDIITSIETSELTDQEGTTRILISLKNDIPYDVTPDDTGIKISFSKTSDLKETEISAASVTEDEKEVSGAIQAAKPVDKSIPAATRLESVYALKYEEKVKVNVNADGVIKNYKSFTIKSPARIVFDIYNIKSPFKKQKTVPVNSKWVSRVRHFGYPDKVRVVLDTKKKFLSAFSAYPVKTGLEIYVGEDAGGPIPASSEKVFAPEKKALVPEEKPVASPEKIKPASAYTKPAYVNRIDFLSKETGKSAVIIGTTHPVNYDLVEVTDKLLRINLFNTKLPKYRRRPLITTRFESAVDRITPFFKPAENTSIVAVELREKVLYTIEQKEDLLLIHFEASSIPPKPFEQANLPSWKKVFAQVNVSASEEDKKEVEEKLPGAVTGTSVEKMPIKKTPGLSQETEYEKVSSDKPGKVYYDKRDQDLYDLKRQRKVDVYTGKIEDFDTYYGKTAKKYTGEKIALDFYETDIKNVFRILKEISGQNFAIDKDVTGKVTLSFDKPVPWDQVLDLVLKMNKLGRIYEGDIIRIATLESLKEEEDQRREKLKAKQEADAQEDLVTAFIPISYTDAKEMVEKHIEPIIKSAEKESKGLKDRYKVTSDERTNMVIITAAPKVIKRAKEIIQKLDRVTPQVMIEAKVVEVNSDFKDEIGIDWSASGGPWPAGGLSGTTSGDVAMNLPVASAGTIGFAFKKITGTPFVLNAQLTALEKRGEGKIISSPKILTLDGKTAMIKHGFQYPYFEISDGDVTVKFKDIVLSLEVTPMVTPDDRVLMQIHVTKDDVGDFVSGSGFDVPSIIKNEAETELLVNDGDTIVIGGIVKTNKTTSTSGWPGLQNIPLLGWLFKKEGKQETSEELLIFITPKIVQLEQRHVVD